LLLARFSDLVGAVEVSLDGLKLIFIRLQEPVKRLGPFEAAGIVAATARLRLGFCSSVLDGLFEYLQKPTLPIQPPRPRGLSRRFIDTFHILFRAQFKPDLLDRDRKQPQKR